VRNIGFVSAVNYQTQVQWSE